MEEVCLQMVLLRHQLLDQEGVVAQAIWIGLSLEAEALIGIDTSVISLVGASPVRAAFIAVLIPPTRLADAEVGSTISGGMAESVVAVQVA